jgi:hypothetical protein
MLISQPASLKNFVGRGMVIVVGMRLHIALDTNEAARIVELGTSVKNAVICG